MQESNFKKIDLVTFQNWKMPYRQKFSHRSIIFFDCKMILRNTFIGHNNQKIPVPNSTTEKNALNIKMSYYECYTWMLFVIFCSHVTSYSVVSVIKRKLITRGFICKKHSSKKMVTWLKKCLIFWNLKMDWSYYYNVIKQWLD